MIFIKFLLDRIQGLGVKNCKIVNEEIYFYSPDDKTYLKLRCEPEWEEAYQAYKRAKSISFDCNTLEMLHNKSLELAVLPLKPSFSLEQYFFENDKCTITLSPSSHMYRISFLHSKKYDEYFKSYVLKRLSYNSEKYLISRLVSTRRMYFITPGYTTIIYKQKGRKTNSDFKEYSKKVIKRCLFKIASDFDDSYILYKQEKKNGMVK